MGSHRKLYLSQGLNALQEKLSNYGHSMNYYLDDTVDGLLKLVEKFQIDRIYCESIDSHEELDEEIRLREHKVDLYSYYQSGLFLDDQIPFNLNELPDVFTNFRKEIESRGVKPIKPSPINQKIKTIKSIVDEESNEFEMKQMSYPKSSFPISENKFFGGEDKGFAFLESYFSSNKPSTIQKDKK